MSGREGEHATKIVGVNRERYYCTCYSGASQVDFEYLVQCSHHMWQSRVEIERYSVVYFDRIAVFEAPYL